MGKHIANRERGVYDSASIEELENLESDSKNRTTFLIAIAVVTIAIVIMAAYLILPRTSPMGNDISSSDTELTARQIVDLYNSGKFDTLIPGLKKYVAAHTEDKEMQKMLASSYLLAGKNKEALIEYKALLKAEPENADILYQIGVILQRIGRRGEAITYLNRAVKAAPNVILFRIELARASSRAKQYNNAIKEWNSVLDLLPDTDKTKAGAIAELANIYIIQTDFLKAQEIIGKGLEIDPENTTLKALDIKSGGMLQNKDSSDSSEKRTDD